MADLFNQQISATYSGLLKTTSSGVLTSSLTQITDGRGNGSPLYISTAAINFYNAYSFPSIDGTADQVLKTDGAGAITWVDMGGGDVLKTGTIAQNRIAIWNDNDSTLRSDATLTINATTHEILLNQPSNEPRDGDNYNIGGGNILATRGIRNVGFGDNNLNVVTNGNFNTAFGSKALSSNTDGSNNVSVGLNSMFLNTEGNNNTAIGHSALGGNSVGSLNTAIGSSSLLNVTGSNNTGIGYLSGSLITTGTKNVIIGSFTGTTGESPTPVYDIRTSSNNIVISDGDGNIRQTFDNIGAASMKSNPTSTQASLTLERISTDVADNDTIGYLNFLSNDSSTSSKGGVGGIAVKAEADFNTSHTPSYMSFYTHTTTANDGTNIGNVTEAMRITSAGAVQINGSSIGTLLFQDVPNSASMFSIQNATYTGSAPYNDNKIIANNSSHLSFEAGGSQRMKITSTGEIKLNNATTSYPLNIRGAADSGDMVYFERVVSGTSYLSRIYMGTPTLYIDSGGTGGVQLVSGATSWSAVTSDIRNKKNFETTQGLTELLQIEPVKYHLKTDDDTDVKRLGFKAQNLLPLIPEMVMETEKEADDGSKMLTITPDYLLPILVKAIQEQQAIIEDLKARIDPIIEEFFPSATEEEIATEVVTEVTEEPVIETEVAEEPIAE